MGSNYQCQPRLAAATVQFNGGTSFSWSGFGIASIVRTGAGVYEVTWQEPRHFAEHTTLITPQGDGSVKVGFNPLNDFSGIEIRLTDSAAPANPVDAGFALSLEPLFATGGNFQNGPFAFPP